MSESRGLRKRLDGVGELEIASAREGDVHVIRLSGELDLATAHRAHDELADVERTDVAAIVVDLSGLAFMDSTGVRLIVQAQGRCRESGRLSFRRGPAAVQRVLELSGVSDLLVFED